MVRRSLSRIYHGLSAQLFGRPAHSCELNSGHGESGRAFTEARFDFKSPRAFGAVVICDIGDDARREIAQWDFDLLLIYHLNPNDAAFGFAVDTDLVAAFISPA